MYVIVECGGAEDPTEALADETAVADVAVADETARRAALWTYREALNEAVNAAGVPHKLDVSVPQAALAAFAREVVDVVEDAAPGARTIIWGHLGDGNLHVNVLGAGIDGVDEPVLRLVAAHGGSIKRALDPAGTLHPGAVP